MIPLSFDPAISFPTSPDDLPQLILQSQTTIKVKSPNLVKFTKF